MSVPTAAIDDLFSAVATSIPRARAVQPLHELGAYEALWAADRASFKSLARLFREHPGALPSDLVPRLVAERHAQMALELASCARIGPFDLCVQGLPAYPARLRDAARPIELLYLQGDWRVLAGRCVAVVGTRRPTQAGEQRARRVARRLARAGFTVLSGLAHGIDTAAHTAAIAAGGVTAAVIGTPLTVCYPPSNTGLQRLIAREFLLVSQVPMVRYSRQTVDGNRLFFPERNATLAALAQATVIIEAGDTSGTLIAARHALQQGRQVLILDDCFRDPALTWPQRLLARGALRVAEPDIETHLVA
jgi:DNA processing protein